MIHHLCTPSINRAHSRRGIRIQSHFITLIMTENIRSEGRWTLLERQILTYRLYTSHWSTSLVLAFEQQVVQASSIGFRQALLLCSSLSGTCFMVCSLIESMQETSADCSDWHNFSHGETEPAFGYWCDSRVGAKSSLSILKYVICYYHITIVTLIFRS